MKFTLYRKALRQTAIELLRIYEATPKTEYDCILDVDAVAAWERIADGQETEGDLEIIMMRSLDFAP